MNLFSKLNKLFDEQSIVIVVHYFGNENEINPYIEKKIDNVKGNFIAHLIVKMAKRTVNTV